MGVHGKNRKLSITPRIARCLFILHPATALLYLALCFTLIFTFKHPIFAVTLFILVIFQAVYFAGLNVVLKHMKMYLVFGIIIAVITPMFNHRGTHVMFFLFDRQFTLEALAYGIYTALLIISILTLFITFNAAITSNKFLYLFSKVAPQTAFIANMTLRFSNVLKSKASEYMAVQNMRSNARRLPETASIFAAFSLWALEDGLIVSETLRAKEYGRFKRTHYQVYTPRRADFIFGVVSIAVFVPVLFFSGAQEYDYFRSLFALSFQPLSYFLLVAYMCIPFCADIFQRIRLI